MKLLKTVRTSATRTAFVFNPLNNQLAFEPVPFIMVNIFYLKTRSNHRKISNRSSFIAENLPHSFKLNKEIFMLKVSPKLHSLLILKFKKHDHTTVKVCVNFTTLFKFGEFPMKWFFIELLAPKTWFSHTKNELGAPRSFDCGMKD